MIAAGANYLKYLITGDASQLKKELADAQQGINNLGGSGAGNNMRTVSGQMDAMTMSAKQLNAATRGLPAQFTDIFVSLQGGQAPLTVLLQQGGQLKDLFGGIMPAAKAMGGYILGLVNPYSLAAAAVIALGAAYYQGSQEADAWHKAMVTSGNAVGVTSSELRSYAQQLDGVVGTQHAAAMALGEMVQAGVAGGAQLRDYTQAAMAWESATGQAVGETAKQFKGLAKEPLEAVLKLNEGANFLTLDLYEQIKALDEQGRTTEAARLAQDAYAETLNDRGAQIKQNLGSIEQAWSGITGAAKKAWDAMLNVGRPATLEEQLAEVEKKLEVALANQSWGETGGGAATGRVNNAYVKQVQEEIRLLGERKWALMDSIDAERMGAAAAEHNAKAIAAQEAWRSVTAANLTKEAKLTRELATIREAGLAAGKSEQEIEAELALTRERYAEKTKKASTATKTAYEMLIVSINEKRAAVDKELSQGEKLTEFEKLRLRYQQDLITRGREYTAQQRADIEAKLAAGEAAEKQAIAERALAKALEDDQKALERLQQQREKQLDTLQSNLQKLQQEEQAHAYAAAAGITHAEAVERLTIARLEEQLAMTRQGAESQTTIDWLERELAVRQQIAQVMGQRGVREANEKAQKELQKDWERTSKTIGDTLADYIMGGGKDAATYLKRLFSTLVLQPVVQTMVGGILGTGAAAASGAGTGIMSQLANSGGSFTDWSTWGSSSSDWLMTQSTKLGLDGMQGLSDAAYNLGNTIKNVDVWFKDAVGLEGGLGEAFGYAQALYSLSQGQYGSAIGSAIGTWILPGIGTMIGSTLGGLVDGMFGGSPYYGGDAVSVGGKQSWTGKQGGGYDSGIGSFFGSYAQGISAVLSDLLKDDILVKIGFDENEKRARAYLDIYDTSGSIGVSRSGISVAKGEEGAKEAINLVAKEAFSSLLADERLTQFEKQLVSAASAAGGTYENLIGVYTQISAIDKAFSSLGETMAMFSGLSDDMKTALLGAAGSIENLTSIASGYYGSSMFTEYERMAKLREQQMNALFGLGLTIDPVQGDKAKEQLRAAVEQAMAAGKGELAVQLMAMSASFAQVADYAQGMLDDIADKARSAALASAEASADQAWRNFEAAIDREKAYWQGIASASQEAIGQITSSVQLLQSTARDLYGTVDSTQQMLAAQGMVYVEGALAAVRAGASITGFDGLQEAITAARGGISGGVYASEFERQRDTLVLAGQLSELGDLGDAQLSIEERALKAANKQIEQLDKTLEYWQQALDFDALNIDATLTVAQAVMALGPLISALQLERAGGSYAAAIKAVTPGGEGPKAALYQQMLGSGLTDAQIRAQVDKTTGVQTDSDWDYLKKLAGLPGYAVGANYIPNAQLAVLHEGEAVIPKAFNPWADGKSFSSSGANTQRLEALVETLTAEVRRLQLLVNEGNGYAGQTADILDRVTEGGNAMRSDIINTTLTVEAVA